MSLDNINDTSLKKISLITALLLAVIGSITFYTRYAYAETGHGYLFIAHLAVCVFTLIAIRMRSVPLAGLLILIFIGVQLYSIQKFSWRENYIKMAETGNPFPLEILIDEYPSFEEYTFTFLGAPDWVRFNEECVQPALARQQTLPRCASPDMIQRYYNIDIIPVISAYFQKMRATAKRIQKGELKKGSDYRACIADKTCAVVPMLPKGVNAQQIDSSSRDYIGVRQAFWSLINSETTSEQTCALTPICRALVHMKVVDGTKIPF
jgi:hypothetical protein